MPDSEPCIWCGGDDDEDTPHPRWANAELQVLAEYAEVLENGLLDLATCPRHPRAEDPGCAVCVALVAAYHPWD